MRYALIKNGTVQNVIIADESFAQSISDQWDHVVQSNDTSPGDLYADGQFTKPVITYTDDEIREMKKAKRTTAVESIIVTISTGKAFDGDELSQSRMSRVVTAMTLANVSEGFWTLANNEITAVTLAELQEAIVLSITRMSELWPLDQYEI